MPHMPDTHITITPKHVYINGEPVCAAVENLEISAPTPTDIQTVTLTIIPTTVTILNEDNPDTINAAYEAAITRSTRDEAGDDYSAFDHITELVDILDAQKRRADDRLPH